jgi:hypothetical protein
MLQKIVLVVSQLLIIHGIYRAVDFTALIFIVTCGGTIIVVLILDQIFNLDIKIVGVTWRILKLAWRRNHASFGVRTSVSFK